jgi:YfiR/HmsC-like
MAVVRIFLLGILLALRPTGAVAQVASEYDLKAAFLYNFTKFVEWPPTAFAAQSSQLKVCILGENPFGKILDSVIEGEEVQGRRLTLLRVDVLHNPDLCHILFVSRSERERIPAILAAVQGSPVLTVSETEGFVDRGGAINFKVLDGKVRFEINQSAAERAGLKMSSKLLRLATRVIPEPRERGAP